MSEKCYNWNKNRERLKKERLKQNTIINSRRLSKEDDWSWSEDNNASDPLKCEWNSNWTPTTLKKLKTKEEKNMDSISRLKTKLEQIKEKRDILINRTIESKNMDPKIGGDRLKNDFVKYITEKEHLYIIQTTKNKRGKVKKKTKHKSDETHSLLNLKFYNNGIKWDYLNKNTLKYDCFNIRDASSEEWDIIKPTLEMIIKYAQLYIKNEYEKDLKSIIGNEKTICERCGSENQIDAVFCNQCGNKLN